jgi:tripartite-type tricarboxylate transporter receptor subunit TctC
MEVYMLNRRSFLVTAFGAFPICATAAAAGAGDFPSRSVRIVVPFAAGTAPDLIARLLAHQLQDTWHQSVVVENRVGASGNVGAEAVARAPTDGYTLLLSPPPPLSTNHFLFKSLPFRPGDLIIVTVAATVPNVLVAHPSVQASDLPQLIELAKSMPGKLTYASTGVGGTPHLMMEWLKSSAGLDLVHVPYSRGLAPALNDLLGGQVHVMFANLSDARSHIEAGKLKAIAVSSAQSVDALPGVSPVSRTLPGLQGETWYAMAAPKGTPPEILHRISSDAASALASASVAERLRGMNLSPIGNSPEEASRFVAEDSERWRKVIEQVGIRPQ